MMNLYDVIRGYGTSFELIYITYFLIISNFN